MRTIFVRQPAYLPALVMFDQMLHADTYVIYDDVQYERRHYGNRNRLRTHQGAIWITVPVLQKGKRDQLYNQTKIDNSQNWREAHWKSIYLNYCKSPYFNKYSDYFEELYSKSWETLLDLNMEIIVYLKGVLDINTELILSSQIKVNPYKDKSSRLANIVNALNGDIYLTSKNASGYLDEKVFNKLGIDVSWYGFTHPKYNQIHGEFIPYMSTIDLLFNYGDKSKDIIRSK